MSQSTAGLETIAYVVHDAKEDFKLEDIVLDEMQDDELLVDMKYSGICHTVSPLPRAPNTNVRGI